MKLKVFLTHFIEDMAFYRKLEEKIFYSLHAKFENALQSLVVVKNDLVDFHSRWALFRSRPETPIQPPIKYSVIFGPWKYSTYMCPKIKNYFPEKNKHKQLWECCILSMALSYISVAITLTPGQLLLRLPKISAETNAFLMFIHPILFPFWENFSKVSSILAGGL